MNKPRVYGTQEVRDSCKISLVVQPGKNLQALILDSDDDVVIQDCGRVGQRVGQCVKKLSAQYNYHIQQCWYLACRLLGWGTS